MMETLIRDEHVPFAEKRIRVNSADERIVNDYNKLVIKNLTCNAKEMALK